MLNTKEIKKRMLDEDVSASHIADALGVSTAQVYNLLRGTCALDLEKAEKMQALLKIHDEDFCFYFMSHPHGHAL